MIPGGEWWIEGAFLGWLVGWMLVGAESGLLGGYRGKGTEFLGEGGRFFLGKNYLERVKQG